MKSKILENNNLLLKNLYKIKSAIYFVLLNRIQKVENVLKIG
jgi:hypothetical protein